MCEKHLKLSQNKPAESDILKHFPDGMVARTKLILTQVQFLTFLRPRRTGLFKLAY